MAESREKRDDAEKQFDDICRDLERSEIAENADVAKDADAGEHYVNKLDLSGKQDEAQSPPTATTEKAVTTSDNSADFTFGSQEIVPKDPTANARTTHEAVKSGSPPPTQTRITVQKDRSPVLGDRGNNYLQESWLGTGNLNYDSTGYHQYNRKNGDSHQRTHFATSRKDWKYDNKMSRGGRGGFGGGRGNELKGASWAHDPTVKLESKPSELFPEYTVPVPRPLAENEKDSVSSFQALRTAVHEGPLYTASRKDKTRTAGGMPMKTYGEDQYNDQFSGGRGKKEDIDPFNGVPTYEQKYESKKRVVPQLSGRPFNKQFFPKELWATLEGEEGEAVRKTINNGVAKRKALMLTTNQTPTERDAERATRIAELVKKLANFEGGEDDGDGGEELAEEEEEEQDYDYEEDEDEMGGDYDGEQYFDGGEDDDDDGGDAGGDDY